MCPKKKRKIWPYREAPGNMIAQRDSTRMVVSKPRTEASGESNPANTLTLDFKLPEL